MTLSEMCVRQGNWLFRYRSYLPLLIIALVVPAAFGSSFLTRNSQWVTWWEVLSLAVSAIGLGVRIYTIAKVAPGTSGRNTKNQIANSLNTTGIYSTCRHPLYLGNFFMHYGIIMLTRSWWLVPVYPVIYWFYYERIMMAEEHFLIGKYGDQYRQWAAKTPAFLPRVWRWQCCSRKFSTKTVLRREYSGFFGMVVSLYIVKHLTMYAHTGKLTYDLYWTYALAASFVLFITLRQLKKWTSILHLF